MSYSDDKKHDVLHPCSTPYGLLDAETRGACEPVLGPALEASDCLSTTDIPCVRPIMCEGADVQGLVMAVNLYRNCP